MYAIIKLYMIYCTCLWHVYGIIYMVIYNMSIYSMLIYIVTIHVVTVLVNQCQYMVYVVIYNSNMYIRCK